MTSIYWHIFLNTTKERTARRLTDNLVTYIGDCEILNFKPYWKDPNLFEVEFRHVSNFQTPDQSLIEFFKIISIVSDIWEVNLANAFDEANQDISVIANSAFKIKGIYWATVSLNQPNS